MDSASSTGTGVLISTGSVLVTGDLSASSALVSTSKSELGSSWLGSFSSICSISDEPALATKADSWFKSAALTRLFPEPRNIKAATAIEAVPTLSLRIA